MRPIVVNLGASVLCFVDTSCWRTGGMVLSVRTVILLYVTREQSHERFSLEDSKISCMKKKIPSPWWAWDVHFAGHLKQEGISRAWISLSASRSMNTDRVLLRQRCVFFRLCHTKCTQAVKVLGAPWSSWWMESCKQGNPAGSRRSQRDSAEGND